MWESWLFILTGLHIVRDIMETAVAPGAGAGGGEDRGVLRSSYPLRLWYSTLLSSSFTSNLGNVNKKIFVIRRSRTDTRPHTEG